MSGGIDGLVSIFDTNINDDDESLLQVVNHGPIHKAGFLSDKYGFALSHDEKFSIFPVLDSDLEEVGSSLHQLDMGDLRESLHCDYVIEVIRAGSIIYIAAGSHNK